MPKVWISNYTVANYDLLDSFGEVQQPPMTTGYVDLTDLKSFYKRINPILEKTSVEDFLALSGSTAIGVVIAHFWLKKHGMLRLLSYNKKRGPNGGYQEIVITNNELIKE